jgi:hypothetical protein
MSKDKSEKPCVSASMLGKLEIIAMLHRIELALSCTILTPSPVPPRLVKAPVAGHPQGGEGSEFKSFPFQLRGEFRGLFHSSWRAEGLGYLRVSAVRISEENHNHA